MTESEFYTIYQLEGRHAAAACTPRPEQLQRNVSPHWGVYIAVQNADASAARAAELGGKILAGPFDIGDAGRMAIIQDPTGAAFSIWQAGVNSGIGIAGTHGTLCWCDLNTPDPARAGQFYSGLFGWQIIRGDEDPAHNYLHIKNGEEFIGGIPPASHLRPGTPAHWLAYFNVSDCDVTSGEAKKPRRRSLSGTYRLRRGRPHLRHHRPARCHLRHLPSSRAPGQRLNLKSFICRTYKKAERAPA